MSRCFPYPPPGFYKKPDPLIETLIKKKRGMEEKEMKKEKKRAKREKKRAKREKKTEKKEEAVFEDDRKEGIKRKYSEERGKLVPKVEQEQEFDNLERSGVTEDKGLPSSKYVCNSSGSSQNIAKRIKHIPINSINKTSVNGMRFRIPLPKKRENELSALVRLPSKPLHKQSDIEQHVMPEQLCLSLPKQGQIDQTLVEQHCLSLTKEKKAATKWQPSKSLPKESDIKQPVLSKQRSLSLPKQRQIDQTPLVEQPCLSLPKEKKAATKRPCFKQGLIDQTTSREWTCLSSSKLKEAATKQQPSSPLLKQGQIDQTTLMKQPCLPLPKQKEAEAMQRPAKPLLKHRQTGQTTLLKQSCLSSPMTKKAAIKRPSSKPLLKQRLTDQINIQEQPCLSLPKPERVKIFAPVEPPCFFGRTETTFALEETNTDRNEVKPLLRKRQTDIQEQPCLSLPKPERVKRLALVEPPCFSGRTETSQTTLALEETNTYRNVVIPLLRQRQTDQTNLLEQPCLSLTKPEEVTRPTPVEPPCFPRRTETIPSHEENNTDCNEVGLFERRSSAFQKMEDEFRNLIVNWQPKPIEPIVQEAVDVEDRLFSGTAHCHKYMAEESAHVECKDPNLESALCSWPPRAILLPKADTYALPYVNYF